MVGDLIQPQSLIVAVEGVDAVLFTHGTYSSVRDAEAIDYGGVRTIFEALVGRAVRMALMIAIAVTGRKGAHDWTRRAERLVCASGNKYTIVRPGWFEDNRPEERHLAFLQGDRESSETPRDGAGSRQQVAMRLVGSLTSPMAMCKTLELVTEKGAEQADLEPLFAALDTDAPDALDGAHDVANMALNREQSSVVEAPKMLGLVPRRARHER